MPKADQFAVVMSGGFIQTFKAETNNQAPIASFNLYTQDISDAQFFLTKVNDTVHISLKVTQQTSNQSIVFQGINHNFKEMGKVDFIHLQNVKDMYAYQAYRRGEPIYRRVFSDGKDLVTSPSGVPISTYGHNLDPQVRIELVKFIQIPPQSNQSQQQQLNLNRFRITQLKQESQGQFDEANGLAFSLFPLFTAVILTIDSLSVVRMFGLTDQQANMLKLCEIQIDRQNQIDVKTIDYLKNEGIILLTGVYYHLAINHSHQMVKKTLFLQSQGSDHVTTCSKIFDH